MNQFVCRRGLNKKLVCAGCQSFHACREVSFCGKYDRWQVTGLFLSPNVFEQRNSVDFRHVKIKQHEVRVA